MMAPSMNEGDILANKTNILLAKSRLQIASWLPPRTANDALDVQDEDEEQEFVAAPELLGLGGTARKDCEVKREELSSNDKLREQLLGRGYAKRHAEGKIRGVQKPLQRNSLQVEGKTRIIQPRRQANDSSEDEGGRSTLGKSKHRIPVIAGKQNIDSNNNAMGQADNVIPDEPTKPPRPPKRANCYLDEVLAERSRKKQKSKRKKHRVATELMTND